MDQSQSLDGLKLLDGLNFMNNFMNNMNKESDSFQPRNPEQIDSKALARGPPPAVEMALSNRLCGTRLRVELSIEPGKVGPMSCRIFGTGQAFGIQCSPGAAVLGVQLNVTL
jgi:hypothetical protein